MDLDWAFRMFSGGCAGLAMLQRGLGVAKSSPEFADDGLVLGDSSHFILISDQS
jgi:hypothetical protein